MEMKMNDSKILTIPNLLSLFRLGLIPLIVWFYCVEDRYHTVGLLLILSGLTDVVDGYIARHYHMISDLGKILDPVADKLTQAAMLVCLLLRYPLMNWPLALMIVKECAMAVSGFLVIRKTGLVPSASWHGKAATVLLYGMMFLHVFWNEIPRALSDLSILLCCGMILVSFALYGLRNMRILRNKRAEAQ